MYTGQLYNVAKITFVPSMNGIADPLMKVDDTKIFGLSTQVMVNSLNDDTIFDENIIQYNYGSFAGTCYEKTIETIYNANITIFDRRNNIVKTGSTLNGVFKITNLNSNIFYDIEFKDDSNKYLGKKIFNIKPDIDQLQPCVIILMDYKKDIIVGSTYKAIFKVYGIGSKGLTSSDLPPWLSINQLDSEFYTVSGTIPSGTLNVAYTLNLSDSRTGGTYTSNLSITHKVN